MPTRLRQPETAAGAIADICQVDKGGGARSDLDLRMQELVVAGADRIQEVLHMQHRASLLIVLPGFFIHRLLVVFMPGYVGRVRLLRAEPRRRALVDLESTGVHDK